MTVTKLGQKTLFSFVFLVLTLSFFFSFPLVHAQETGSFGNNQISDIPVSVSVQDDFYVIDSGTNIIYKFRNETFGYNEIWLNDSILVQNELWYLEYRRGGNYRPRGLAQTVTVNQISPYEVEVIREYTDFISTDFNMTFSFVGGYQTKISFNGYIGQTDEYRIRWSTSGINKTYFENVTNAINFYDVENDKISFNYQDVYLNFGNITNYEIEENVRNHKLDLYFNVGILPVGNFSLDPSFGFDDENEQSASESIENFIKGAVATCPESGTGVSITAYLYITTQSHLVKCALYDTSGNYISNSVTEEKDVPVGAYTWVTFNFGDPAPSLSNQDYVICAWGESTAGSAYIGEDNSEVGESWEGVFENYNGFPASVSFSTTSDKTLIIYCNYTVSGGINQFETFYPNVTVTSSLIDNKELLRSYISDASGSSTLESNIELGNTFISTGNPSSILAYGLEKLFSVDGSMTIVSEFVTGFEGGLEIFEEITETVSTTTTLIYNIEKLFTFESSITIVSELVTATETFLGFFETITETLVITSVLVASFEVAYEITGLGLFIIVLAIAILALVIALAMR